MTSQIDVKLTDVPPWKIVAGTATTCLALHYVYTLLDHKIPLHVRVRDQVFRIVKKIPSVKKKITDEKGGVFCNISYLYICILLYLKDFFTQSRYIHPDFVNEL